MVICVFLARVTPVTEWSGHRRAHGIDGIAFLALFFFFLFFCDQLDSRERTGGGGSELARAVVHHGNSCWGGIPREIPKPCTVICAPVQQVVETRGCHSNRKPEGRTVLHH
jgi:hypothetical protein